MSNAHKRMSQSMDGQGAQQVVGIVTSFNPADHTVKCEVWGGMDDAYVTDWLPLGAVATFAGGGGVVAPPMPGEQVLLIPEQNDHGSYHVAGRIFSTDHLPPNSPATGKPVMPGEFGVFTKAGAYLHMEGENIHSAGTWTHTGKITASDDVLAGNVSLKNHVNTGIKAGSDNSGPPAQ
jgi:phage baseplate assembly protein gpV